MGRIRFFGVVFLLKVPFIGNNMYFYFDHYFISNVSFPRYHQKETLAYEKYYLSSLSLKNMISKKVVEVFATPRPVNQQILFNHPSSNSITVEWPVDKPTHRAKAAIKGTWTHICKYM